VAIFAGRSPREVWYDPELCPPGCPSPVPSACRAQKPSVRDPTIALTDDETVFLWHWLRSGGQSQQALEHAGYHPTDDASADAMALKILNRIDEACDVAAVLRLSGHGPTAWAERIVHLSYSGNLKMEAVGVKLWGLAAQYFSPPSISQGASINVHVLQANHAAAPTPQAGLVHVSIEGQRP
jgi:hypothetical protein